MRQRRRLLRGRVAAVLLEQRERRHPGGDRREERLAEERPERDVLPQLDVARAPVVHQHDAENVLGEALWRYGLAAPAGHTDDEAELELEVETLCGCVDRRARVWGLELPARPEHVGAADGDRARAAVISDGVP